MEQKDSAELLARIYENARTGADVMKSITAKTHWDSFRQISNAAEKKYISFANEASALLGALGSLPPERGIFSRLEMHSALLMSRANGDESSIEMIISGCSAGVIELLHALKSLPDSDARSRSLAGRLIAAEQENISLMQRWLTLPDSLF